MAITQQERTNILKLTAGIFNAAPGALYLNEFVTVYEHNGHNLQQLAADMGNTGAFQVLYPASQTAEEFAAKFLTPLGLQGNAEAVEFMVSRLNAGESKVAIIFDALAALDASTSAEFADAKAILANKAAAAEYYSVTLGASSEDLATLQNTLALVTADPNSVADANNANQAGGGGGAKNLTLTHGADNLVGTAGDDVFKAPVTQNGTGSGQLANTFETGDVLDGGAGHNTLQADLIGTGTVSNLGGVWIPGAPISATTKNIQDVFLRAQMPNVENTIDAERMAGVEQWWTDNSRSDIIIEDIRTDTSNTAFGMRLTDPGVSFFNYFNALFLEGDTSATSAVTLNVYEGPLGSPDTAKQLQDISVHQINFQVAGETFTLASDAMKAANTWDELEAAIKDELAKIEGAETITVTNRGNGQFVLEDSLGREFQVNAGEALLVSVANNITFTNALTVGREEVVGPIISSAILDGAGNGSQGGTLNIGAMSGLRGVEELNLSVDRDSHLQSITSYNQTPGQYGTLRNGEANEFLEVVNLSSTGAEGDLTVGRSTANLDGRVSTWSTTLGEVDGWNNSGFVNLREFNAADFAGDLNIAFTLDNNVDRRYLKHATEAVTFKYTGGAQDDIFNIADRSTMGISGDTDFAMEVDMGAGNDRLILDVPTVRAVKVDGGTGENSIVVSQSHGTNAANTFAEFKNFQTYEVEGTVASTSHNFASMGGVQNVVVATGVPGTVGVNTALINLEADQNVTISGKNQTIGNASAGDQNFGTITLTNDAGADRTITLDNTARLSNATNGVRQNGVLTVNNITIDTNPAATVGATKDVTIESNGVRTTANAIASFNGRDVESLTLTGTQDLTVNVATMANQNGAGNNTAMTVDGSALTGNLNLAVNGAMLDNNTVAPAQVDRFVGTSGAADNLMLYGALNVGNIQASGFEAVQLGSWGGGGTVVDAGSGGTTTMFGDLAMNQTASGALNVSGLGVNTFNLANVNAPVTLSGMGSGATVNLGDANRNEAGNRVANQTLTDAVNLVSSSTVVGQAPVDSITIHRLGNIQSTSLSNINLGDAVVGTTAGTSGFKTINLVVDHAINQPANASTRSNIDLDVGSQARTLNVTGGNSPTNVSAKAGISEVQTVNFAGLTVDAAGAGNITVGGVTVALANGDTAAQIAGKVAVALNAEVAGTAIGDATFVANGTTVTAAFPASYGNVADNLLAVADGTATFTGGATAAGTAVNAVTTQGNNTTAAVAQQADVLDLTAGGNQLLNSLEKIDLSGFQGQVILAMEEAPAAATQTDVNFVLSKYNANITLSDGVAGAGGNIANITHNSVFDFTGAGTVQVPTQWTVANIVNAGHVAANVNNQTLFDVRDLGIQNYAQLKVLYVNDGDIAVDAYGNALAAGQAVIRSESEHLNGNVTWEIVVTGVAGGLSSAAGSELTEANFGF